MPERPLPFRQINHRAQPDHDPGLQRHHLLPRQLLTQPSLAALFARITPRDLGFDDFRRNGLLLPATEAGARVLGLPLHRGPHGRYNAVVLDRVGAIEVVWSRERWRRPLTARSEAVFRFALLQQALRRRLLSGRGRPIVLNQRDPAMVAARYAELDALADQLWADSAALDIARQGDVIRQPGQAPGQTRP